MVRGDDILSFIAEFFEEFFARAQAGELDMDIAIRHASGKLDQVSGEVEDFYRLPHIQKEDFSALSLGGALKHQADGFGDGHEVAHDVRVSDFDRSTGGDLPG